MAQAISSTTMYVFASASSFFFSKLILGIQNSNIVQLFSMLRKDAPSQQLVYYQAGIGTYGGENHTFGPIGRAVSKALDGAIAIYMDQHVKGTGILSRLLSAAMLKCILRGLPVPNAVL